MLSVPCPYCSAAMVPPPQRKRKCAACGKPVYYKSDPVTRQKNWITEEQAERFEQQWVEYHQRNSGEYSSLVGFMGEAQFIAFERDLRALRGDISFDELMWTGFEAVRPRANSGVLFTQAQYAFRTERPHFDIAQESNRRALEEYLEQGITSVEIVGGECGACKKLDKRKLRISDALETMPIPCESCTSFLDAPEPKRSGWCRCCYVPSA